MTTPTILSNKAINPNVSKYTPQNMLFEKASALVPGGTTVGTLIGMIRFREGFVLNNMGLSSDSLGGGALLNVGYILDASIGEDKIAYINDSGITNAGGSTFWPNDGTGFFSVGRSPVMPGPGYLSFEIAVANTGSTGVVHLDCSFSYDS